MISRFFKQDSGAIIIIVGLLLLACIGFAALAIDVSFWYSDQRKLQIDADAGAIGGAIALNTKGSVTVIPEATYDIQLNNCTSSNNCTIVAINNPPASGPNAGNNQAVEVILSKPADLFFAQLFLPTPPTLIARAVAGIQASNNCVTALTNSGIGINVKGGGSINAVNCGVYSNSSAGNAINVVGGGSIQAQYVKVVGGVSTSGGGTITSTNGISQGVSPAVDPYAGLQIPAFSGCTKTNYSLHGTETISPGTYCGGISLVSNANLTLNPGIYIIEGDFTASSQSTITGNGVTIIVTKKSSGSGYGTVTFNAGLTANLTATSTPGDPFNGILFYGDRNAPASNTNKLTGGLGSQLNGVAYFPSTSLEYSGQASSSGVPCFRIIAREVTFVGGSILGAGCQSSTGGPIVLLE
jgi:hypothetical protein